MDVGAEHDSGNVYPASEDTYLMMDTLQGDVDMLREMLHKRWKVDNAQDDDFVPVCIEIGCGSGQVIEFVKRSLFPHAYVLATDVNPDALSATRSLTAASGPVDTVAVDLFSGFATPNAVPFDIVVFNPPYVPTDAAELRDAQKKRDIAASWAGGPPNGRVVINRFLRMLPALNFGVAYLLVLEENDPTEIATLFSDTLGLQCDVASKRKAGIETLYVLRITKHE